MIKRRCFRIDMRGSKHDEAEKVCPLWERFRKESRSNLKSRSVVKRKGVKVMSGGY